MGRQKPGAQSDTTEQDGIAELNRFAKAAGIPGGELLFDEGSGLSRSALITPNAIVQLLAFMARHPAGRIFREALPIAGVDGSLRNRIKGTGAEKNVHAKRDEERARKAASRARREYDKRYDQAALEKVRSMGVNLVAVDLPKYPYDPMIAILLAEFKGRSDTR